MKAGKVAHTSALINMYKKIIILLSLLLVGCDPIDYNCVGIQQHNEVYDESYIMVCEDAKGKRTYDGMIYDQEALDRDYDTFKLWVANGCPSKMEIE